MHDVGFRSVILRFVAIGAFVGALSFAPLRSVPVPAFHAWGATPAPAAGIDVPFDDVAVLLPDDLLVCAEARGLGALAQGFLGSPLERRITGTRAWAQFEKSPEHAQLLAGLGFLQLASGWKPADFFGALLGDELVAGLVIADGQPGLVAALRTRDAETAEQLVTVARNLALANKESKAPVAPFEHDGLNGIVLDQRLWLVAVDRCVVAASSASLAQGLIERALAPAAGRAAPKLVAAMRTRTAPDALLRLALDRPRTAATRPDGQLLPARADNLAGGMLIGDLLAAANGADFVTGELVAAGDDLALRIRVPVPEGLPPEASRSFGHARAQEPLLSLAPRGTLLSLSLRRDWAQYWLDHTALCEPKAEKEFADFETNLALFFGGRSIPDDVLPRLDDEILFVLSRQTYPGIQEPPTVKYPAGAFVWRAKAGAAAATKLGREFAVGVTSLVALINIDRAMKNQTPLLPFVEPFEEVTVYGGRFLSEDDRPVDGLRHNVSPCATWIGERVIVASSEELLHDLVHELNAPKSASLLPGGRLANLRLDAPALAQLLRDDREALVTNAVLSEAKERADAERQQDLLAEVTGSFRDVQIGSRLEQGALIWELALTLLPERAP